MKFKKGQIVTIVEIDEKNIARVWLIGSDRFMFRMPKEEVRVLYIVDNHDEIRVISEHTFNRIKKEKQFCESLFPYDKEFKDLEPIEL